MSDDALPEITKESLLAKVRSTLDRESGAADMMDRGDPLQATAFDDTILLDLARSLNLCAQRIYAFSQPPDRVPDSVKRRLFILRLKPLERLAVRVVRSVLWKHYATARETAEAVETIAAALRCQDARNRALMAVLSREEQSSSQDGL